MTNNSGRKVNVDEFKVKFSNNVYKWFGTKNVMSYFASVLKMKRKPKPYNLLQQASAVLMVAMLLWLTVSAPFVYASQQELTKQQKVVNTQGGNEEEAGNAFGNSPEEKKPSGGNSFSEEYLHDYHTDDQFISAISPFHKSENAGVYTAFHGEVHVPPPNVA